MKAQVANAKNWFLYLRRTLQTLSEKWEGHSFFLKYKIAPLRMLEDIFIKRNWAVYSHKGELTNIKFLVKIMSLKFDWLL